MYRKAISILLIICIISSCMLSGCSKSGGTNKPTGTVSPKDSGYTDSSKVPTTISDNTDYGTDVTNTGKISATPEPSSEPTAEPTAEPTLEPTSEPTAAPTAEPTSTPAPTAAPTPVEYKGSLEIPSNITDPVERMEYIRSQLIANTDYYNSLDNYNNQTWCFKRMKDHSQSGSYESFRIADYNSCYIDTNVSDNDKVIYLTFDCGYPSELTPKILDTLAAHNVKANFFVTKMYLQGCPDYARRMVAEGHAVCNHTVNHEDLTNMSVEKIASEIIDVAEYFYEITGTEFAPYFRTPTGAYTKRLLSIIRDAGYKTVFWSIAYGDYDKNNQPKPGYVTDHFTTYHHNGAIALMHNDSTSNANELDAVLTLLENAGYRFALLSELK